MDTGEFSLSARSAVGGKTVQEYADGALSDANSYTMRSTIYSAARSSTAACPANYADFSHAMRLKNGGYFLRVASPDLRRVDDTRVRTVRDVIIEVDASGEVVDEWRLFEILDPNRNIVLKSIDQGAVCLNIDASKSGQTLSAEELAKMDETAKFGDIAGVGPGRTGLTSTPSTMTRPRLHHHLLAPSGHRQDRPRQEDQVDPRFAGRLEEGLG